MSRTEISPESETETKFDVEQKHRDKIYNEISKKTCREWLVPAQLLNTRAAKIPIVRG